ncbi:MAG: aspartate-semialdehyde dehydrogenase [Opitutales bacterium]
MKVGIVGASGLVGRALLTELLERFGNEPIFYLFCSENTPVKTLEADGKKWNLKPITDLLKTPLDVCFFATPASVSEEWIPKLLDKSTFVIDGSSVFRQNPDVSLIIPEINPEDLKLTDRCVSSPNCTTTLALMALAPLDRQWSLESFSVCSYQAASGMGQKGLEELLQQSNAYLSGEKVLSPQVFPRNLAFNVIPQIGSFVTEDQTEEEEKICKESRKILHNPNLKIFATCVRVPVLRCHSMHLTATFKQDFSLIEAQQILQNAPGLRFYKHTYPDTQDASGNSLCHIGRLRLDPTHPKTLSLWLVGDQLLKGAASNMRQIFELKLKHSL